MSEAIVNRIIITGLLFVAAYILYMLYGDKPIIYPYFWRTVHYMLVWGVPFVFLILLYPLHYSFLSMVSLLSLIIFFGTFIIFNLCIANLEYIKFKEAINSRNFSLLLVGFEGVMLIVMSVVELCSKFFKI